MTKLNLQNFDLKGFLDERGIGWKSPGHKNVGSACILGVCCPYCFPSDNNFHCGVLKESFVYSCFKCGVGGSLFDLLNELTGINYGEFFSLVKSTPFIDQTPVSEQLKRKFNPTKKKIKDPYPKIVPLPPRARTTKLVEDFLSYRQFSPELAKYYGAYPCLVGKYRGRLILPIYNYSGERIAFQARLMRQGKLGFPYLNPKFRFGEHLYWLHQHTKNWVLLVEGIFDKWRFGGGAVATFRNNLTQNQLLLLLNRGIKKVFIGWEADSLTTSVKVAEKITPLFDCVKVLRLPERIDPDKLGRDKMIELMNLAERI